MKNSPQIFSLTVRQKEVYDFIREYISKHHKAPYIREIQEACNIKNHKSVIDRFSALERKGFIKRKLNKHRGIILRLKP